jgi:hypothetical protein
VGLFPARAPQLVLLVKIDNPGTTIFGGRAAAPIAKSIIQGALASREAPFDAIGLASERLAHIPRVESESLRVVQSTGTTVAVEGDSVELEAPTRTESIDLVSLTPKDSSTRESMVVPDLNGETLREAVRRLHAAGFRVQVIDGRGNETSPPAGTRLPRGSIVRVRHR